MPHLRSPPIDQEREVLPAAIDREWAVSLVGLGMMVAANFVPGSIGEEEYIAENIAHVNVDDDISASCIFMLELDDSIGTFRRIQYDAMLRYANNQHDNFHAFNLPSSSPLRVIHLTRRQFDFLYENILTFVQISTIILPPPQKEVSQTEAGV